jgi:hypothetical protein
VKQPLLPSPGTKKKHFAANFFGFISFNNNNNHIPFHCQMEQHITAKGLAEHTSVLASPEFEGRLPASQGEERTLRYLTTAFAQLGCSPAGDKQGTQSFTQIIYSFRTIK